MSEVQDLTAAVTGLRQVATELRDRSEVQDQVLRRIENLAKGQEVIAAYGRKNRLGIQIGSIGLTIALFAAGLSIYQSARLNETTHQLSAVQSRTSTEVLCPLYQLFALSLTVNPAPSNYTAEQLELREKYKLAINDGLAKLDCPPLSK